MLLWIVFFIALSNTVKPLFRVRSPVVTVSSLPADTINNTTALLPVFHLSSNPTKEMVEIILL